MDYVHLRLSPVLSSLYAQETVASLRWTRLLLAIWCLMSVMEWIANRDLFKPDGLLSWRILSLRTGLLFRSTWTQSLFWDRSINAVLGLRFAAALALLTTSNAPLECAALLLLVAG